MLPSVVALSFIVVVVVLMLIQYTVAVNLSTR